jgi:FtsP/CotA-like multicopper oxidase with cupredoxin domain
MDKDTVLVPAGQTMDILVEMSNSGAWMIHCHITEHLESGMRGEGDKGGSLLMIKREHM